MIQGLLFSESAMCASRHNDEPRHHIMACEAHPAERSVVIREVAGSNPVARPNKTEIFI